jgi:uncharacterized protein (TIGR03086 family)
MTADGSSRLTEADVFVLADLAVNRVVQQIRPDQWSMPIPDWFPLARAADRSTYDLRKIVNYLAYDEAWVPATLNGQATDDHTGVPSSMDEDLLGEDPAHEFQALADKALAAAKATDLDRIVHLSYGDFPAREYLKHITSFRGFRAHDIAKLIGADTRLGDDLVQGMWDEFAPEIESWRAMGVFGPAVEVAPDAPLQDRLLALCGRDPR